MFDARHCCTLLLSTEPLTCYYWCYFPQEYIAILYLFVADRVEVVLNASCRDPQVRATRNCSGISGLSYGPSCSSISTSPVSLILGTLSTLEDGQYHLSFRDALH